MCIKIPECTSLRTSKSIENPEVWFRIIHVTHDYSTTSSKYHEQTVEISLGPKPTFRNGDFRKLSRKVESKQIVSAVPPRLRNRKPPKEPTIPRVVELLKQAQEWQRQLENGDIENRAQIARQENISRARVTQIFMLLNLAPEIQEQILKLSKSVTQPVTERMLRPITQIDDPVEQRAGFEGMILS